MLQGETSGNGSVLVCGVQFCAMLVGGKYDSSMLVCGLYDGSALWDAYDCTVLAGGMYGWLELV